MDSVGETEKEAVLQRLSGEIKDIRSIWTQFQQQGPKEFAAKMLEPVKQEITELLASQENRVVVPTPLPSEIEEVSMASLQARVAASMKQAIEDLRYTRPCLFKTLKSISHCLASGFYGKKMEQAVEESSESLAHGIPLLKMLILHSCSPKFSGRYNLLEWQVSPAFEEKRIELKKRIEKLNRFNATALLEDIFLSEDPKSAEGKVIANLLTEMINETSVSQHEQKIYAKALSDTVAAYDSYTQTIKNVKEMPLASPIERAQLLVQKMRELEDVCSWKFLKAADFALNYLAEAREKKNVDETSCQNLEKSIKDLLIKVIDRDESDEVIESFSIDAFSNLYGYLLTLLPQGDEDPLDRSQASLLSLWLASYLNKNPDSDLFYADKLIEFAEDHENNFVVPMPVFYAVAKLDIGTAGYACAETALEHAPMAIAYLIAKMQEKGILITADQKAEFQDNLEAYFEKYLQGVFEGQDIELIKIRLVNLLTYLKINQDQERELLLRLITGLEKIPSLNEAQAVQNPSVLSDSEETTGESNEVENEAEEMVVESNETQEANVADQIEEAKEIWSNKARIALEIIPELVRIGAKEKAIEIVQDIIACGEKSWKDSKMPIEQIADVLLVASGLRADEFNGEILGPLIKAEPSPTLDPEFISLFVEVCKQYSVSYEFIKDHIELLKYSQQLAPALLEVIKEYTGSKGSDSSERMLVPRRKLHLLQMLKEKASDEGFKTQIASAEESTRNQIIDFEKTILKAMSKINTMKDKFLTLAGNLHDILAISGRTLESIPFILEAFEQNFTAYCRGEHPRVQDQFYNIVALLGECLREARVQNRSDLIQTVEEKILEASNSLDNQQRLTLWITLFQEIKSSNEAFLQIQKSMPQDINKIFDLKRKLQYLIEYVGMLQNKVPLETMNEAIELLKRVLSVFEKERPLIEQPQELVDYLWRVSRGYELAGNIEQKARYIKEILGVIKGYGLQETKLRFILESLMRSVKEISKKEVKTPADQEIVDLLVEACSLILDEDVRIEQLLSLRQSLGLEDLDPFAKEVMGKVLNLVFAEILEVEDNYLKRDYLSSLQAAAKSIDPSLEPRVEEAIDENMLDLTLEGIRRRNVDIKEKMAWWKELIRSNTSEDKIYKILEDIDFCLIQVGATSPREAVKFLQTIESLLQSFPKHQENVQRMIESAEGRPENEEGPPTSRRRTE